MTRLNAWMFLSLIIAMLVGLIGYEEGKKVSDEWWVTQVAQIKAWDSHLEAVLREQLAKAKKLPCIVPPKPIKKTLVYWHCPPPWDTVGEGEDAICRMGEGVKWENPPDQNIRDRIQENFEEQMRKERKE